MTDSPDIEVTTTDDVKVTQTEVRRWAQQNGIDVPTRGRIPESVVEQYKAELAGARDAFDADEDVELADVESNEDPSDQDKIDDIEDDIESDVDDEPANPFGLNYPDDNALIGVPESQFARPADRSVSRTTLKLAFRNGTTQAKGVGSVQIALANNGYTEADKSKYGVPDAHTKAALLAFKKQLIDEGVDIEANDDPDEKTIRYLGFTVTD